MKSNQNNRSSGPWLLLGTAIAVGYALGRRSQGRAGTRARATTSAPLGTLIGRLLADASRPIVEQLLAQAPNQAAARDRQITTAPDASWSTGAGTQALGFDSPPITSSYLSNPEVAGVAHAEPYDPPGGAPDGVSVRPHPAFDHGSDGSRR